MQGNQTFRRDRTCQNIKCNPLSTRLCPHPTIIKKMKTYLELEGKLDPKLQPQSDQSRPAQPITNSCMRKETKATEKRKKLTPIKKYKVKVVEKPESNNTSTWPPTATPIAPPNLESQKPSQEGTSENNPPPFENIPVCTGTPWPKAGKCQGTFSNWEKTGWFLLVTIQLLLLFQTPHKDWVPGPRTTNYQFNISTKGRNVWMGTKLPYLQKCRGWLGWWWPKTVPTAATTQDAVPPDPKLPEAQKSQTFDFPDRHSSQLKLHREWQEGIERLNNKYDLNCFQTLNSTQNQMRKKSTDMNIIMKHSSKFLKSIDDDIKNP